MIGAARREDPILAIGVAASALLAVAVIIAAMTLRHEARPLRIVLAQDVPVAAREPRVFIDAIDVAGKRVFPHSEPLIVPKGAAITARGWAIDGDSTGAAVFGIVDASDYVHAESGLPRPDVAAALHTSAYARSGFMLPLSTAGLGPGTHSVRVLVIAPDVRSAAESAPVLIFRVR